MSSILFDEHGIPYGWQDVRLTEEELDEMCDALDVDDEERAERVVEGAYARLFGESVN
ncbi:MAG TPA: hypothetical protein VN256_08235 [Pyrinomonadaceae bacterium]|nr:hypothetical protein [Pyrinomonadaceae bacterium]